MGTDSTSVDTEVLIVGAGPVGLSLANLLALRGTGSIVLEQLDDIIDYPRAIGIDDEALRSIQTMGLIDAALPHTTPQHIMRLVNGRGRLMAEIAPNTDEFGWPRRNAFGQPEMDRELYQGLSRFDDVEVRFGHTLTAIHEEADRVVVDVTGPDGSTSQISARWLAGCEGGRSLTRKHMGVSFEGISPSTRWLVIDMLRDPLGTPNIYLGADPARPYVSVGLPGAVRRFEFMLFDDEPDELAEDPQFIERLLTPHVPDPTGLEIIRRRIFTHHSRVAGNFRQGRLFLVGDAAHLMPVWQGQGYNSGLRDATNLAWKLADVVNGRCDPAILDTYTVERRDHAKAMVDLSTAFGRVVKPTSKAIAGARDVAAEALNLIPAVKQYFVQMKYKPMPRYSEGVVVDGSTFSPGTSGGRLSRLVTAVTSASTKVSPVGTQFPQPRVRTADGQTVLLDEVLGLGWAVVINGSTPEEVFGPADLRTLRRIGARLVTVRPVTQAGVRPSALPGAQVVADVDGTLKRWFDQRPASVVFLRPDRFVGAAGLTQDAPRALAALAVAMHLRAEAPPAQADVTTTVEEGVLA